jgi:hypothetical protein
MSLYAVICFLGILSNTALIWVVLGECTMMMWLE